MTLKHYPFILSAVFVVSLSSCGGEKKEEPTTPTVDTTTTVNNKTEEIDELADFKFHVFIANIPSPLEAMVAISNAGITLDKSVLNPVENAEKYNTLTKKALNYGAYGTDLGYLAAYDMSQEVTDYFAAVKVLAEDLGAADQFDKVLADRFQANLGNRDSLLMLMDNALGATDDYLKNNQRLELACLTMTGSWTESQYILVRALIVANEKGDLKKLYEMLPEQKNHLKNLIDLLAGQSSKDCKTYKAELEIVKASYDKINTVDDVNMAMLQELSGKLKTLKDKITK